jgi:hypothetical protein
MIRWGRSLEGSPSGVQEAWSQLAGAEEAGTPRSTADSAAGAAQPRQPRRSATPSSLLRSTSCATACPTTTSVATGSTASDPNSTRARLSTSSTLAATASPSTMPPEAGSFTSESQTLSRRQAHREPTRQDLRRYGAPQRPREDTSRHVCEGPHSRSTRLRIIEAPPATPIATRLKRS